MKAEDHIVPDWPVPPGVRALSTTRVGGVSRGPHLSLNLGMSCGDDEADVLANRERLCSLLPSEPLWMRQVHGTRVLGTLESAGDDHVGDGRISSTPGEVLVVLTADCLPVLLCDKNGREVAAVHAGWRGLAGGVIESTVAAMHATAGSLIAWLGPCIGGAVYEVGSDVREAFASAPRFARSAVEPAFVPHVHGEPKRWLLSLETAARVVLEKLGVSSVHGGGFCTFEDAERFFSHRRDGVTGRMASLIWLEGS